LYLGTRPIFVTAAFLLFGTTIWCAVAQSWNSFVAARVIGAFAASCGEALPATVVKDLFFLHERGWWMGVYMWFFQCALQFGGIASGFTITAEGWRWHFWVNELIPRLIVAHGHCLRNQRFGNLVFLS
jgi:MFS family permease